MKVVLTQRSIGHALRRAESARDAKANDLARAEAEVEHLAGLLAVARQGREIEFDVLDEEVVPGG